MGALRADKDRGGSVKIKFEIDIDPHELDRVPAIVAQWNRQNWLPEPIRNRLEPVQSIAGTLPGTLGGTTIDLPGTRLEPVHSLVPAPVPTGTISGTNSGTTGTMMGLVKKKGDTILEAVLWGACITLIGLVLIRFTVPAKAVSNTLPKAPRAVQTIGPKVSPGASTIDQLLPIQKRE